MPTEINTKTLVSKEEDFASYLIKEGENIKFPSQERWDEIRFMYAFESHTQKYLASFEPFKDIDFKDLSMEGFFLQVKKILDTIDDVDMIKSMMKENIKELLGLNALVNLLSFPAQMLYGLMFNRLKDLIKEKASGNFTQLMNEAFPQIPMRTRQNYMLAAQILEFSNLSLEKYYAAGISILYRLAKILKNKKYKITNDNIDPILNAFQILNRDFVPMEDDYQRMVVYYVFWEESLSSIVDPDLYFDLFKSNYKIKQLDVKRMKKNYPDITEFPNKYIKFFIV